MDTARLTGRETESRNSEVVFMSSYFISSLPEWWRRLAGDPVQSGSNREPQEICLVISFNGVVVQFTAFDFTGV